MRFRGKSIRRKIVGLLLVPLVSLTSIWAFATVITGREAKQLLDTAQIVDEVGLPAEDTVQMLQQERRQTLVHLADPRKSDGLGRLHRQEAATDQVVDRLRANAREGGIRDGMGDDADLRLSNLLDGLEGLETLRAKVEEGTISRPYAFAAYNALIDPAFEFLNALHALDDAEMDKQGRAIVGVTRAREELSREDALLASALAAGRISQRDQRAFSDLVANRKLLYSTNLPVLPAEEGAVFEKYWNGPDTVDLRGDEERVINAPTEEALDGINAERWQAASSTVLDALDRMGADAGRDYQDRVQPIAVGVLIQAAVAGVLGFAAVLVSIIVSVRIGRALVRDLTRLRKEAHEVSGVRLPSVMRRLAAGEQVDVETEAPRLEYGQDEMGQVGKALNTLQRAALEAAVRQADMRRGVSEVFVNLARRSQVLLHRQLTLLDTMERRTEDTEELADLFRLDHLTTRMRRHAEGLVILSGAAPSRQWRKPIPLMDVVRAAVAEVEDYERVEVRRLPRMAVTGPAVADVTHLIAELLENATVFSPPHTAVQVLGERVANGFTLEIHDRGLGMAPDALLDANLRLAETPEFELSDTDRLGLFVVSRLARRQGVRVSLQTSPYGGTTAVVFIPSALLTDAPSDEAPDEGEAEAPGEQERSGDPLTTLAQFPLPMAGTQSADPALDGPVELEAPVSALDDDDDGLIFRGRGAERDAWRGRRLRQGGAPAGRSGERGTRHGGTASGEEPRDTGGHEQVPDNDGPEVTRPDRQVPLPRRTPPPVLVSDHGRPVDAQDRSGGAAREETDASREEAGTEGSRPRAEASHDSAGERPSPPAESTATSVGGLPRRVRQASLAPQLKTDPAQRAGQHGPRPAESEPERDAEEVRARMASLQRGWQRGRAQTGEDTASGRAHTGEDNASGRDTASGTTPEGDGR
ncbi:nitrate- and nitrite sensing domain-containing protein [Streptomyces sp. NPDC047108]|uniref:sensor histidine kinase n=1 Tax=Streptomyces sp. NPDC047108 TaxID=3155025 RepID=UPI003401FE70